MLDKGVNPLDEMFKMQNSLQEALGSKFPERCKPPKAIQTKGELTDFLKDQKSAIDDEFRELFEAVVGMSRDSSIRSANWKKWKSKYDDIRSEKTNENLTSNDVAERSFEAIDIFHFVINLYLGLDIDAEMLFVMYCIKNKENFDRQDRGY